MRLGRYVAGMVALAFEITFASATVLAEEAAEIGTVATLVHDTLKKGEEWSQIHIYLPVLCNCSSSEIPANPRPTPDGSVDPRRHEWQLLHYDNEPSIQVGQLTGYRIFLRTRGMRYVDPEPRPGPQQGLPAEHWRRMFEEHPECFETEFGCSVDLVLFPEAQGADAATIGELLWVHTDRDDESVAVHMGSGHGFTWFGNMPRYCQQLLRQKLDLSGGDNPLQLLADGLKYECSVDECDGWLRFAGEPAIPYIQRIIETSDEKTAGRAVEVLGGIQGPRATKLLATYFNSDNEQLRRGALLGLMARPYREDAKDAYLEMLRRNVETRHPNFGVPLGFCVKCGWKEAIPILTPLLDSPEDYHEYCTAFVAKRALEGHSVPIDLSEKITTFLRFQNRDVPHVRQKGNYGAPPSEREAQEARDFILAQEDKESVALLAAGWLMSAQGEGSIEQRCQNVAQLLRLLPEGAPKSFLADFAGRLRDEEDAKAITALLELL